MEIFHSGPEVLMEGGPELLAFLRVGLVLMKGPTEGLVEPGDRGHNLVVEMV